MVCGASKIRAILEAPDQFVCGRRVQLHAGIDVHRCLCVAVGCAPRHRGAVGLDVLGRALGAVQRVIGVRAEPAVDEKAGAVQALTGV